MFQVTTYFHVPSDHIFLCPSDHIFLCTFRTGGHLLLHLHKYDSEEEEEEEEEEGHRLHLSTYMYAPEE
jgi:hypothetical protein